MDLSDPWGRASVNTMVMLLRMFKLLMVIAGVCEALFVRNNSYKLKNHSLSVFQISQCISNYTAYILLNKDKVNVRKKRNRLQPFCITIFNVLKISIEIINKYCRCLPPLSWTSPCWSGGWPSRWTASWLIGRVSRYVHHCTV